MHTNRIVILNQKASPDLYQFSCQISTAELPVLKHHFVLFVFQKFIAKNLRHLVNAVRYWCELKGCSFVQGFRLSLKCLFILIKPSPSPIIFLKPSRVSEQSGNFYLSHCYRRVKVVLCLEAVRKGISYQDNKNRGVLGASPSSSRRINHPLFLLQPLPEDAHSPPHLTASIVVRRKIAPSLRFFPNDPLRARTRSNSNPARIDYGARWRPLPNMCCPQRHDGDVLKRQRRRRLHPDVFRDRTKPKHAGASVRKIHEGGCATKPDIFNGKDVKSG